MAFDGSENDEVNIEGLGPYIFEIHEKCPIFASPFPFFLSVRMGPNWDQPHALERRSLGYKPINQSRLTWNAKNKTKMLSKPEPGTCL